MRSLYRAVVQWLPPETRQRHGAQLQLVFDEQLRDAAAHGRLAAVRVAWRELASLLRFVWRERRAAAAQPIHALPAERSRRMAAAFHDFRHAARLLGRSPGFTAVALVTLALAIGANTAIFSVVNAVLLRALPFAQPAEVVVLGHRTDGGDSLDSTTPGNLHDWMAGATAFSAIAGFSPTERIITVNGNAERIRGGLSVGSVFSVLGRDAAYGRTLTSRDDDPAADPVIVLSARLARRLFGDENAVGRTLLVNSAATTVVGVMPADFAFFGDDDDYWVPARFDAAFRVNRDQYFLLGVARLRPGVSIAQAHAQLNTVMDGIRRAYPQFTQNATALVLPIKDVLLDGIGTRLLVLMAAVGVVLLIACANLANLLLARATARQREMAVRHALGADRQRLIRQLMAESLLLALAGGAAGLAMGAGLLRVLVAYLPESLPRRGGIALDGWVLAFTFAVALLSGLIFGALPAAQITRRRVLSSLREGARSSARAGLARRALVASQVALALVLLAGAGLLLRSFVQLTAVPPGFRTDRLLTFTASVPTATYRTPAERAAFFERAASELATIPGVETVTLTTTLPVAGRGNGAWFNIVERPWPESQTPPGVPNRVVRANYFDVLGIPLRRGRTFTAADGLHGTRAVVISESVARRFFPDSDPLGQHIYMGTSDNRVVPESAIVGVVADVKQTGLDEERPEAVYVPHALVPSISSFTFALRTSVEPAGAAPAVRAIMRRLDPGVPLIRLQTMDDIIGRTAAPARSSMVLVGVFAAVALILAVIGVFGVLSYMVGQQTSELGIRMALGATAGQVQWGLFRQGLVPVAIGVGAGLTAAVLLARYLRTLLFGVTATDAPTFAAVVALLAATGALAAYLPTRRATRLDPVRALRAE